MDQVFEQAKAKMEKTLTALHNEYATMRAGKASASVLDKIAVDYYGTPLYKTRDFYYVSELNGNRAVLRADSMTGPVYCAANVNNLRSV